MSIFIHIDRSNHLDNNRENHRDNHRDNHRPPARLMLAMPQVAFTAPFKHDDGGDGRDCTGGDGCVGGDCLAVMMLTV
eukprot:8407476-Pyramimonas_sp.AAC.1